MQQRTVRWARRLGLGAFVTCATLAATAAAAFATTFTANVTPGSVGAGTTTPFTIVLTNTSVSNPLNSAVIKAPSTFTLTSASLGSSPGSLTLTPNKLTLTGLNLAPNGGAVTVTVGAAAPCAAATGFLWSPTAYVQGVGSRQLNLVDPSSVSTDVTGACSLQFVTEPNNALVNTPITGNSYDTGGPPVTVQVLDANGNATNSSAAIDVELGTDTAADNNPDAVIQGTNIRNASGGVATFKNLSIDVPNNHYTLVASTWGMTSGESSQFDIGTRVTNCSTGADCILTLHGSASTLTIDAGGNTGQLVGQVDPGTPMDGPGSNPKLDPGCADYTPQNPDWYGFDVVNQDDESGPPAKTLTWTVQDATPDGFQVCFGSTSEFLTVSDGDVSRAPEGTLPDGDRGFVGFLPFCDQLDGQAVPCITDDPLTTQPDANSTTGEDVIVDVSIPADFPGDPFMGRG